MTFFFISVKSLNYPLSFYSVNLKDLKDVDVVLYMVRSFIQTLKEVQGENEELKEAFKRIKKERDTAEQEIDQIKEEKDGVDQALAERIKEFQSLQEVGEIRFQWFIMIICILEF